uniref:Uncharacterized protein n=1 Tax=Bicosoecida sp. CB-2014 TaxID=1486930 RepID=A0A7S1GBJ9_9STRA
MEAVAAGDVEASFAFVPSDSPQRNHAGGDHAASPALSASMALSCQEANGDDAGAGGSDDEDAGASLSLSAAEEYAAVAEALGGAASASDDGILDGSVDEGRVTAACGSCGCCGVHERRVATLRAATAADAPRLLSARAIAALCAAGRGRYDDSDDTAQRGVDAAMAAESADAAAASALRGLRRAVTARHSADRAAHEAAAAAAKATSQLRSLSRRAVSDDAVRALVAAMRAAGVSSLPPPQASGGDEGSSDATTGAAPASSSPADRLVRAAAVALQAAVADGASRAARDADTLATVRTRLAQAEAAAREAEVRVAAAEAESHHRSAAARSWQQRATRAADALKAARSELAAMKTTFAADMSQLRARVESMEREAAARRGHSDGRASAAVAAGESPSRAAVAAVPTSLSPSPSASPSRAPSSDDTGSSQLTRAADALRASPQPLLPPRMSLAAASPVSPVTAPLSPAPDDGMSSPALALALAMSAMRTPHAGGRGAMSADAVAPTLLAQRDGGAANVAAASPPAAAAAESVSGSEAAAALGAIFDVAAGKAHTRAHDMPAGAAAAASGDDEAAGASIEGVLTWLRRSVSDGDADGGGAAAQPRVMGLRDVPTETCARTARCLRAAAAAMGGAAGDALPPTLLALLRRPSPSAVVRRCEWMREAAVAVDAAAAAAAAASAADAAADAAADRTRSAASVHRPSPRRQPPPVPAAAAGAPAARSASEAWSPATRAHGHGHAHAHAHSSAAPSPQARTPQPTPPQADTMSRKARAFAAASDSEAAEWRLQARRALAAAGALDDTHTAASHTPPYDRTAGIGSKFDAPRRSVEAVDEYAHAHAGALSWPPSPHSTADVESAVARLQAAVPLIDRRLGDIRQRLAEGPATPLLPHPHHAQQRGAVSFLTRSTLA